MDVKASRNHSIPDRIFAGRYKRYGWLNAIKNAVFGKGGERLIANSALRQVICPPYTVFVSFTQCSVSGSLA